jgi:hypothetical protein
MDLGLDDAEILEIEQPANSSCSIRAKDEESADVQDWEIDGLRLSHISTFINGTNFRWESFVCLISSNSPP